MLFRKPSPELPGAVWHEVRDAFPVVAALPPDDAARLRELVARFLAGKSVEPVQGLEMDLAARAAVAALACLPVLELGLDAYSDWSSVVVYPGGFVARGHDVDEAGVVHEFSEARSGESWFRGPVVLSWEDVAGSGQLDGYNVVIHEMAHKLDMLDGDANGRPPLHPGMDAAGWYRDLSAAFDELNALLDAGESTPIDAYAAHSPGEFFAVASEYFFEIPQRLAGAFPRVYDQLRSFYRQHPIAR